MAQRNPIEKSLRFSGLLDRDIRVLCRFLSIEAGQLSLS